MRRKFGDHADEPFQGRDSSLLRRPNGVSEGSKRGNSSKVKRDFPRRVGSGDCKIIQLPKKTCVSIAGVTPTTAVGFEDMATLQKVSEDQLCRGVCTAALAAMSARSDWRYQDHHSLRVTIKINQRESLTEIKIPETKPQSEIPLASEINQRQCNKRHAQNRIAMLVAPANNLGRSRARSQGGQVEEQTKTIQLRRSRSEGVLGTLNCDHGDASKIASGGSRQNVSANLDWTSRKTDRKRPTRLATGRRRAGTPIKATSRSRKAGNKPTARLEVKVQDETVKLRRRKTAKC